MKIVRRTEMVGGGRRLTIDLAPGEDAPQLFDSDHYRLGGQHGDIVPRYVIEEAVPVSWCHITQKWIE